VVRTAGFQGPEGPCYCKKGKNATEVANTGKYINFVLSSKDQQNSIPIDILAFVRFFDPTLEIPHDLFVPAPV
jgi:hypothetical protein